MQVVTKELNKFLVKHGASTFDIVIQCDGDCICFAKAAVLKHERKGIAHTLSDYVAWVNGKNKNFKNVKEIDVTPEISDKIDSKIVDRYPIGSKQIANSRTLLTLGVQVSICMMEDCAI